MASVLAAGHLTLSGPAAANRAPEAASPQANSPYCYSAGYSVPPSAGNPVALTYSWIGSRSNGGYTYRYWMVQEVSGSTLYYQNSLIAKCSGQLLVSVGSLTASGEFGTPYCTSPGDITQPVPIYVDRLVGQRTSWRRGYLATFTFRYWHREASTASQWIYDSSRVAWC